MRIWRCAVLLAAVWLSAGVSGAYAQATQYPTPRPQAEKPLPEVPKPKLLQFSVELRWRSEFRDNADLQPADDFDAFTGQRFRFRLRIQPHRKFSFLIEGQDVELFGAESDKVIHDLSTNLYQAYFDWKIGAKEAWEFRGGRQELIYGEERLVGAFGWDQVGRSFDGARLRQKYGPWTNDFFWARVVDVKRNGARARAPQDLSGAYLTRAREDSAKRTEVYGLFLRDSRRTSGEISTNPLATTRIFTAGWRRAVQPRAGWRYSVENAWQFGERGPDGHFAAMLILTGGYAWGAKARPRVQLEYGFATGDNDPGDGKSREFHNLFPTNHFFYGTMDLMGLRNMQDFRVTLGVTPSSKFGLDVDYHHLLLAESRGAWKNAGGTVLGVDPTGQSGRDVGQELDFTARLPLHPRFNLMAGYSLFRPGTFARRTRGPETQRWGFIQTTIRF
jgi:hypothetical protein